MQIVKFGNRIKCPIVVCLGFFGCMHKGHLELLNRAKKRAKETNSKVALFTFSNNHLAVLGRDSSVVYTFDERLAIYRRLSVDYVIAAKFDSEFKSLSGKQFLQQFTEYDLKGVVCGFDHRCGSDRLDCFGISQYFKELCTVDIVEQVSVAGEKVSTTLLRDYLSKSQLDKVNYLLSEPFFVVGKVVHGRGVGKTLGFPTANISVPSKKLLPIGVFVALVEIAGQIYKAIVNIGSTPTFGIDCNTIEVHLLNYVGDLYGKTVKVSLTRYIRPIVKFSSPSELSAQLKSDKETALND